MWGPCRDNNVPHWKVLENCCPSVEVSRHWKKPIEISYILYSIRLYVVSFHYQTRLCRNILHSLIFERQLLIPCSLHFHTWQRAHFEFPCLCWIVYLCTSLAQLAGPGPSRGPGASTFPSPRGCSLQQSPFLGDTFGVLVEGELVCRCEPAGFRAVSQQTLPEGKITYEKNCK